jgi:hypothetical protein
MLYSDGADLSCCVRLECSDVESSRKVRVVAAHSEESEKLGLD